MGRMPWLYLQNWAALGVTAMSAVNHEIWVFDRRRLRHLLPAEVLHIHPVKRIKSLQYKHRLDSVYDMNNIPGHNRTAQAHGDPTWT